uniref:Nucleobase-ascorbate transporter 3 n=2 Tax=Elaeis guineensis var. tenera TaxID=51953 RepID=A0A8N4I597_ELAGV|nr:nucleobase-ascorbate transporter 3 [Elaeis guineensis]
MLGTIVMLATFLVPKMGGSNGDKARIIQTFLFMSGINTLLQTLIGTRLPTVMNASLAFVIPVLSIINDFSSREYENEHERFVHTIRAIQGALIVSSFLNIIIGYSRAWGDFSRFFSPVVIVPVVCVVGLGLFERGFPQVGKCVEIGLPMLILLVFVQQYMKHINERTRYWFERFALLLCIVVVWSFAAILTAGGAYNNVSENTKQHCRTDRSHLMSSAPWIRIPYPFQWGAPIFTASHVFGMMGAVLVAAVESTGAHYAAARLAGATPPPAHVLSRSIGLQGIGMLLEGIFGAATGSSASIENVGLLGLTRVGSRRVVQISTGFMIFFSIFGKFGAFFASIPFPIFAAMYCVLFGIVAAVGISFIQFANNNSMRNLYIIGLALFLGISIPQYFNEFAASAGHGPAKTNAGWFNDILNAFFSSAPFVAMIVGTLLDNTLEARNTGERGLPWWVPFQKRTGDVRNDEFYGFPIRVHEMIPTRYLR